MKSVQLAVLLVLSVPTTWAGAVEPADGQKVATKGKLEPASTPTASANEEPAAAPQVVDTMALVASAKELLTEEFRDPAATQFRRVSHVRRTLNVGTDDVVCGEFNAKNGYGAYTGFKRFIVHDGKVAIREDIELVPGWTDQYWIIYCKIEGGKVLVWSE